MLILLAGLQSRPLDVVEAARIDGASAWQIFRNMTLPHLRQYIELAGLLGVDLRRPELRRRLHDHLGWPGHGQPAVLHLPDLLHRPRLRPGLGRRRRRRDRHDHHRDLRAAHGLQPVQEEADDATTTAVQAAEQPGHGPQVRRPTRSHRDRRSLLSGARLGRRLPLLRTRALDDPHLLPQRVRRRDQPALVLRAADPRRLPRRSSDAGPLAAAHQLADGQHRLHAPRAAAGLPRGVRPVDPAGAASGPTCCSSSSPPRSCRSSPGCCRSTCSRRRSACSTTSGCWSSSTPSMNLPIAVWMMRSFLAEVPVEMLEAAQVDGAGLIRTLRQIVAPVVMPGHRLRRPDLLHLQLERAAPRPRAHRHGRRHGAGLPHRVRHQPGPVPRQGVRGVASSSRCRCSSPGSPRRTSSSRACRWVPSSERSMARSRCRDQTLGDARPRRWAGRHTTGLQVTPGIVHFGVGGFHRAHEAMYLDALMNDGRGPRLGPVRRRRAAPRPPDHRDPAGAGRPLHPGGQAPDGRREPRVIGSHRRRPVRAGRPRGRRSTGWSTPQHPDRLADHHRGRLPRQPGHRRVRRRRPVDPGDLAADFAGAATPTTVFGFITAALDRRRRDGRHRRSR